MMKCQSIIFIIGRLIDNLADLFYTRNLCSITFFFKLVHAIRECGKHFLHQSNGDYIIHAMRRMALGRVQLNLKY